MQQVIELSSLSGWLCYHTHDSRRSQAGFPDLVMIRGERLIFAELKSEKGKTSSQQDEWLSALKGSRQGEVYVWRPSDWDELVGVLE